MMNNPLIERYRYSQLRPRQLWVFLAVYLVVIGLILLINASIYKYQDAFHDWTEFFRALYYQFLILQVVILWIWSGYNTGTAIKEELLQKSYDFFRMLPMSAKDKVVGIIVGKNLVPLLLAMVNVVFLFVFGVIGDVNAILREQFLLVLISIGLAVNMAALMVSMHRASAPPLSLQIVSRLLVTLSREMSSVWELAQALCRRTWERSPAILSAG